MRTMLALMAVAAGVAVAGCDTGGRGSPNARCEVLVLEDTTQVFASQDKVMAMSKRDTLPKPYSTCVTLYAAARDTLPKPR
jgi:hypothetical protein